MEEIDIRECVTIEELDQCVRLQREVFGLSDLEISPRRHLIVSRQAGGWTLGAYTKNAGNPIVGFVHHLVAIRGHEIIGYSHMMAVHKDYQNLGLGARLKWAQRERALAEGRRFIRWTWEPMQARNAHFNLNRLGVIARSYGENFYGTDYVTDPELQYSGAAPGLASDRIFAGWELSSPRVVDLATGAEPVPPPSAVAEIEIPADWADLIKRDVHLAKQEQLRVRKEFQQAFAAGLVCAGFARSATQPRYLLYKEAV